METFLDVYFFVIPPNVIKIKINYMAYIFLDNQKLNTEFEGFSVEEDPDLFSISFFLLFVMSHKTTKC